jgi:hypothetical protein
MPDGIRWVGLDVHARESTVAVLGHGRGRDQAGGGPPTFSTGGIKATIQSDGRSRFTASMNC